MIIFSLVSQSVRPCGCGRHGDADLFPERFPMFRGMTMAMSIQIAQGCFRQAPGGKSGYNAMAGTAPSLHHLK